MRQSLPPAAHREAHPMVGEEWVVQTRPTPKGDTRPSGRVGSRGNQTTSQMTTIRIVLGMGTKGGTCRRRVEDM